MKKLLFILLGFISLNATDIWNQYIAESYTNLIKQKVYEQKIENLKNKENKVYQINLIQKTLMEKNLPEVIYKKPKEIYIYVRKNYKIIDGNIIVLEPSNWKVVLIKPEQEWQY